MSDKPDSTSPEPKQNTEKGLEVPIPKREDVLRDLEKLATPEKGPKRAPAKP